MPRLGTYLDRFWSRSCHKRLADSIAKFDRIKDEVMSELSTDTIEQISKLDNVSTNSNRVGK